MNRRIHALIFLALMTGLTIFAIQSAPIALTGANKADLMIRPINWFAGGLIDRFGQSAAISVVGGIAGGIAALLLLSMLPSQSRPTAAKTPKAGRGRDPGPPAGREARKPTEQEKRRLLTEFKAKDPEGYAKALAEAEKVAWPTADFIAWQLSYSDTFTYRKANEVFLGMLHLEGEVLSQEDFLEAQRLWEAKRHGEKPCGKQPRPILIARKARLRGQDWSAEPSHFGGLPKLGDAPWPRGKDGRPLPFVAQIDLAQIAAQCPESPLPHEGSLAFFINEGAVIYTPPGVTERTPAPADLPHAFEEGGEVLPQRSGAATHQLFPFWPIEPIGVTLPPDLSVANGDFDIHDQIWEAQFRAFEAKVAKPEEGISLYRAMRAETDRENPVWWYAAHHVARRLRQSLSDVDWNIARHQDSIAGTYATEESARNAIEKIKRDEEGLSQFVQHFDQFVAGRDPWKVMAADELNILTDAMAEARQRYSAFSYTDIPTALTNLRGICFQRMITGDEAAFAQLPDDVLNLINTQLRREHAAPHQMFGLGVNIQTALDDHLSHLLLFQLTYDYLPEMRFGDVGSLQFWIRPDDARARRWDKVELTFESH